jgi:hypothetical protein
MGWANARVIVDCGMNSVPNRNILIMLVRKTDIGNRMPAVRTRRVLIGEIIG